jgi:hypothetical protein
LLPDFDPDFFPMSEQSRKLRAALETLRDQLDRLDDLDSESSAVLREAVEEIHTALGDSRSPGGPAALPGDESGDDEDDSPLARLRRAAERFEQEHPTLSGTVGGVIDALAQMGI